MMKKKLLKSIFSSIVLSAFFACSNEIPEELDKSSLVHETKAMEHTELVEVVDGILKFKNAETLCDAIINPEIVNTAKSRANTFNFKSLDSKYVELEKSHDLMVLNEVEYRESASDDFIHNRVRSRMLADFLNEEGIMLVGDLAVKVMGDYAYSTSIDRYEELSQLSEKELKSSKNITVDRIILPLLADDSVIQTKGSSGGAYERSPVFILTNDKKRREHVKFNPYLLVIPNAQTQIVIEMEGRAQIKQIFGIWGGTFNDEMNWGEIYLHSGSWHYNQPSAGGMNVSQGTNYFIAGTKARSVNQSFCGWAQKLGNSEGVSNVKADITYKAKKSDYQPSDWTGEYRNNYTSITK